MYSQYAADQLFEKLEMGKVSEDEFYFILKEIQNIETDKITNAWNAMLLEFRFQSFEYIKKLRPEFKVCLLSNTNAIHRAAFDKLFIDRYGISMDTYFDKPYYSHMIGLRKPNEDIFQFVLEDSGFSAEETLFVDDSYNNIETAEKLGFKTHLLKAGENIENILPNYLISS